MSAERPLSHSMSDPPKEPASAAPAPAPPASAAPASPAPGGERWLAHYRLERVIGAGGMGVVHEAWDARLRRRVALKVLSGGAARSSQAFERFRQEATLAARLQHPNIVVVHEAGLTDGQAFIAMELVEGHTLEEEIAERLGEAALLEGPAREAARKGVLAGLDQPAIRRYCGLIRDVARALHCGHTYVPPGEVDPVPIVHRDVKPANVMVDRHGQARLLDYGLAKEVGVTLTVTREAVGTPLYMSPEQLFSARRVGPRSDVYSLGMTLYAVLTLARPFELSRPDRLFSHLMHDDPARPRALNPALPRDLETIVLKATAKDERQRYATAEEMAEDLAAFLEDRPIKARPPSLASRVARLARRHTTLTTLLVLALLVPIGLELWSRDRAGRVQEEALMAEQALLQQKAQAANQAGVSLISARLAFELAAEARGQDPEGDRWLWLLNEGHRAERSAVETLARTGVDMSAAPPRVGLLLLEAQTARGEASALERLRGLLERADAATALAQELDGVLDWLPRLIESDARGLAGNLRHLAGDTSSGPHAGTADQALALHGLCRRLRFALPRGEAAGALARLEAALRERLRAARQEAAERPRAAAALHEALHTATVRVRLPGQSEPPPGLRVVVRELAEDGRAIDPPLASGAPGEPLAAGGTVLVSVEGGAARPVRFPLRLPRPVWGAPPTRVDLELPFAPGDVPEGMALVCDPSGPPFLIEREEVSRAAYARFLAAVRASDHATCPVEERAAFPEGKDHAPLASGGEPDHPVSGVDWWDARAYAAWSGSRLPTRGEWSRAALAAQAAPPERAGLPRGSLLQGANLRGIDDGWLWCAPAASGPEAPCGARGLFGNVAEWLEREDPDLPFREAAGGGFADATGLDLARHDPLARGADLGFRCVRSIPRPPSQPQLVPAGMVLVPGRAWSLRDQGPRQERWELTLGSFAIDARPVSNAAFAAWLRQVGRSPGPALVEAVSRDPEGPAEASWEDASAFAAAHGKRLPSEAEWTAASQARALAGSGPDPLAFGLVHEWCADAWHPDFVRLARGKDPLNRWTTHLGRVVRDLRPRRGAGPGWTSPRAALDPARSGPGFRCAIDLEHP